MELPDINISPSRIIHYCKWRSIELSDFSDFIHSSLCCFSASALEDEVSMLTSVLLTGLASFALLKSCSVSFVRSAPWCNEDLCAVKASCRMSGLAVLHQAWKDHLLVYKSEMSLKQWQTIFLSPFNLASVNSTALKLHWLRSQMIC